MAQPKWEFKVINLEEVYNPEKQIRDSTTNENIDELSESIKSQGLLQPIGVCNSSEVGKEGGKKYHLVWGQKRMKATRMAGKKEINAMVYDMAIEVDPKDIIDLAITENLFRTDMSEKEEHESIIRSYNNHGRNLSALIKALPLPEERIRRAIKELEFQQVDGATELREYLLDTTRYKDDLASRVVRTCKVPGNLNKIDLEKAKKLTDALGGMEQSEHKKLFRAANLEPDDDVETWVLDAQTMDFPKEVKVTFLESELAAIEKVAEDLGVDFRQFITDSTLKQLTTTDLISDGSEDLE